MVLWWLMAQRFVIDDDEMMIECCGGLMVVFWREKESDVVGSIRSSVVRTFFGFGPENPPEKFSGGGATVVPARSPEMVWWERLAGYCGREREYLKCVCICEEMK
ncbi:hypothetical protein Tco_0168079 [Tanacetum coccineum]